MNNCTKSIWIFGTVFGHKGGQINAVTVVVLADVKYIDIMEVSIYLSR